MGMGTGSGIGRGKGRGRGIGRGRGRGTVGDRARKHSISRSMPFLPSRAVKEEKATQIGEIDYAHASLAMKAALRLSGLVSGPGVASLTSPDGAVCKAYAYGWG